MESDPRPTDRGRRDEPAPTDTMDWEQFYAVFRKPDFIPGYEIQNRLGGGAFGEVYKARKTSIGKAYAVKFLKVEDEAQRELIERELEQVRHLATMDHPNLVSIEDLGVVSGVPYLIMGYAGEDTLARRLRRERLEPRAALGYFVQTCRGVLALHDRRLVHFDLKPGNVFLKGDVARVGDYGLAKLMLEGHQTLSFGRGTPRYMAPEMLKGRADHRADIYSLGVILYECLAGRLPYPSEKGSLVLREDDEPPDFDEDYPPALEPATRRCLRLDPEDRFDSVKELLAALGQTARRGDSIAFPIEPASIPEPQEVVEEPAPPEGVVELPAEPADADTPRASASVADARAVARRAAQRLRELSQGPPGSAGGTVPVPPCEPGGPLSTLRTALGVGLEVLASLITGPGRRAARSLARAFDGIARGGASVFGGLLRLLLFLLFMIFLGAAIIFLFMALVGSGPFAS